jgi:hypothetical protein
MARTERSEKELSRDINAAIAGTEDEIFTDAMGDDELDNDGDTSLEEMGEGLEGDHLDKDGEGDDEDAGDEEDAEDKDAEEEDEASEDDEENEVRAGEEEQVRDDRGRFDRREPRIPPERLRHEAEQRRQAGHGRHHCLQTTTNSSSSARKITREYIRENLFSPYIGTEMTAIIRVINDLKKGGEQINIPLIARLKAQADRDRHPRRQRRGDRQLRRSRLDRLGAQRRQDPEVGRAEVLHRPVRPGAAAARGLGQGAAARRDHRRVLRDPARVDAPPASARPTASASTAPVRCRHRGPAQHLDHRQRGSHPVRRRAGQPRRRQLRVVLANITSGMTLSAAALLKMKRLAKKANPRIRPYKLKNGREYFVVFVGSNCFRDCRRHHHHQRQHAGSPA